MTDVVDLCRKVSQRTPASSWLVPLLIATAFLIIRVPLMYRQPGGQDEDWFAIPGWTVSREGIPRVPYAPSRLQEGAFYKADVALFALPPAYFYWQAPLFWVLPAGFGTSRLASGIAGLIAVGLVYRLGREFLRNETAALWAAGFYSISRVFYFPATTARPDMLCGMFGLAAVWITWTWSAQRSEINRHRSANSEALTLNAQLSTLHLLAAGVLLGLGMLTHPFAIVYCLQVGVWVLIVERGWRRWLSAGVLTVAALLTFALWLPLIWAYPEVFEVQFRNNVLDRSGPGLLYRLLMPWDSLVHQAHLILEHAGALQTALMALGLVIATLSHVRRPERGSRTLLALSWSSLYLLAACQGAHPTKGYWCYPGALLFLCVADAIQELGTRDEHRKAESGKRRAESRKDESVGEVDGPRSVGLASSQLATRNSQVASGSRLSALGSPLVGTLLLAAMLPGAGLRTWVAHLRHWNDVEYNSPRFVARMLRDLPPDARYLVDPGYVFDAYLSGRPTVLAVTARFYFQAADFPYDIYIAGPYGLRANIPEELNGQLVRTYGNPHDLFACYAEVYVPKAD